ncbi:MAG: glutathione S-transferase family protein [Rhodospirillaceae bacterium]|nr:glutathione S-transferase family protein [Rhodospirillaceae bacterium]
MIKLYDSALSGNCHKVRMMLGFLGLAYEKVDMNWARGDHRLDWFRAVNPRAQLPALDDAGTIVWDSQAILVYLARSHGGDSWLPLEPLALTRVMQWLMLANEEVRALSWARVAVLMKQPRDKLPDLQGAGRAGLAVLERHLQGHAWLAADRVTIADIACFPYVGLAPQGEVSLDPYPAVRAWIARIKALANYVPMPGLE